MLRLIITLNAGTYPVAVSSNGNNYGADQTVLVPGINCLELPPNDATITITSVHASGGVTGASISGTANTGSASTLGVSDQTDNPRCWSNSSVTRSTTATTDYTEVIGSKQVQTNVGDRIHYKVKV